MFCYFCLLQWLDYSTIQVCNIPFKGTLQASSSGFLKMQRKAWFLGKQHHLSPDDGWLDAVSRTSEPEWCPNVVNDGLVPQPSSPILQYGWLQGLHGKLFLCQKWMSLHNSTVCYKMACVIHHNKSLHPKKVGIVGTIDPFPLNPSCLETKHRYWKQLSWHCRYQYPYSRCGCCRRSFVFTIWREANFREQKH